MAPPSPTDPEPKITPRIPDSNPNISTTPPIKEFAQAGAIVVGVLLLLYWSLGWIAGWMVTRIPDTTEATWGNSLVGLWADDADDSWEPTRERVQQLVDALGSGLPPREFPYVVHLVDSSTANAAALPGGHLLIFTGLLEEVESENELAMILGHELGHLRHRHNLRGLGRRLVLIFMASLAGADVSGSLLGGSLELADLSFSRSQELEADEVGLELLVHHYGHVGGAGDFFRRHWGHATPILSDLLSSHPISENRIEALEDLARERGYAVNRTTPFEF